MNRISRYYKEKYAQMKPQERLEHFLCFHLSRALQTALFEDAFDFMYDNYIEAYERKNGINPMKSDYITMHKAKQHILIGELPDYDCRSIPDGSEYCSRLSMTAIECLINCITTCQENGLGRTETYRDVVISLSLVLHSLVFPEEYEGLPDAVPEPPMDKENLRLQYELKRQALGVSKDIPSISDAIADDRNRLIRVLLPEADQFGIMGENGLPTYETLKALAQDKKNNLGEDNISSFRFILGISIDVVSELLEFCTDESCPNFISELWERSAFLYMRL